MDNLCPAQGETPRALNIKKAILSLLQNSMKELEVSEDVNEVSSVPGRKRERIKESTRAWSGYLRLAEESGGLPFTGKRGTKLSAETVNEVFPARVHTSPEAFIVHSFTSCHMGWYLTRLNFHRKMEA